MKYSAVIIAIVLLLALLAYEVVHKKHLEKQVKEDKDSYNVPLSDDVQRIYYDTYEKEMERLKTEEEHKTEE